MNGNFEGEQNIEAHQEQVQKSAADHDETGAAAGDDVGGLVYEGIIKAVTNIHSIDLNDFGALTEAAASVRLSENEIERLLAPLDAREREILKLRFGLDRGEPRTLQEVGEHFNLTRDRIRTIEARAMSKLRGKPGEPDS